LVRLVPYLLRLWIRLGRVDVVHVMANSGWSWHLWAAPAILLARLRGVPVVLNYRGGEAAEFFMRSWRWVRLTLLRAQCIVVPSAFLQHVFDAYGVRAVVVPNVVDLARFRPDTERDVASSAPNLLVTRNLEPIYDIATAIRTLARLRVTFVNATLTVAGSGPDELALKSMARSLEVEHAVRFAGRIDNAEIPSLYWSADLMLNPSLVDNAPNSILEAWATGVPVVSTDVGGIRFLVEHERNALLVPVGSPEAMAAAASRILADAELRRRLKDEGLLHVQNFAWTQVGAKLYAVYAAVRLPPASETERDEVRTYESHR
jgi:glycosyltransferase involved in cell wall biosynthesis